MGDEAWLRFMTDLLLVSIVRKTFVHKLVLAHLLGVWS